MSRRNLEVQTRALVNRILFAGRRAIGVEYIRRGRTLTANAGEVICCGGSINTPQILQLSGVGNRDELRKLGIASVHHLPGVGENLQDHLEVYIQYACRQPVSMYPYTLWHNKLWVGLAWLLFRRGPAATNHFEAGGFIRSNPGVPYPNLMFHFLPLAIRYDGSAGSRGHGYQVHVGPMYSNSRGSVRITSADARVHPALRFNYLSTPEDRQEWLEAVQCARHILNQPAFDEFNGGETSPGQSVQSDDEILRWVAKDAETALHPCGSCKMGRDDMAVIDPETMAVHGVEGLRVVDASAMPYLTNGNIYAPVMMLAEKAADLILGNSPLPPEQVPFYRHEVGELSTFSPRDRVAGEPLRSSAGRPPA
jgi:choline dehydrogenase